MSPSIGGEALFEVDVVHILVGHHPLKGLAILHLFHLDGASLVRLDYILRILAEVLHLSAIDLLRVCV